MSQTEPNFQFRGTPKNQEKLRQIFRLLLSVPTGYRVIAGIVKSRRIAKNKVSWLNHPPVSMEFSEKLLDVAGMTDVENNNVKLSQHDANGQNIVRHPTPENDIMLASTLGHELCHVMTRYGYLSFMMCAQTPKEALLTKILCEEDAWFIGDKISGELYAVTDGVIPPVKIRSRIQKYSGLSGRTAHFQDALDGRFGWAQHERRMAYAKRRFKSSDDPNKRAQFNELLQVWLKNAHIDLPLEMILNAPVLQPLPPRPPKPKGTWIGRLIGKCQKGDKC